MNLSGLTVGVLFVSEIEVDIGQSMVIVRWLMIREMLGFTRVCICLLVDKYQ